MAKFGCLTSRFVLICWAIASIIYNFYFLKKIKFSDDLNTYDVFVGISAILNIILDIYVVIFATINNCKWLERGLYIIVGYDNTSLQIANIAIVVVCFILSILHSFGVFGDEEAKSKLAAVTSLLLKAVVNISFQALEFVWIRTIVKRECDKEWLRQ